MGGDRQGRCTVCKTACDSQEKCQSCREAVCIDHSCYTVNGDLLCVDCMAEIDRGQTEQPGPWS